MLARMAHLNLAVHQPDGRVVQVHVDLVPDLGPFGIRSRRSATLDEGDLMSPEGLRGKLALMTETAAGGDVVEARLPDTLEVRFLHQLGVVGPPSDPIELDLAAHG
jgi:hypothetical protein